MKAVVYSGLAIKQLLADHKVSVRSVAERLKVTEQSVYEILRKNEVKRSTALKFYEALGIEMPDKETLVPLDGTTDFQAKYIYELEQRVAEQSRQISEQSKQLAQLAQSNQALIEKLGKFEASGLLAGYDA